MTTYPLRRGELVQSASTEGWTVYDSESDSLHALNETARAIWELCDGSTSPTEMAGAIAELTELDGEAAVTEVTAALGKLAELGLVDLGGSTDLLRTDV